MIRRERILSGLDLAGVGLEIGAGYNPVVSKDEFRVDHLDHADREALIQKYAAQGIDTSRVQQIDYVWSGQTYAELVGDKRYDWIIASHVIEHVPNPIGFVNDCAAILTDGGVLSLVVPDKRSCFDYYRPPSSLARLIDAFVRGDTRTTAGAVVEHIMYAAVVDGSITWNGNVEHVTPTFLHNVEQARELYDSVVHGRAEHDVHAWVFTPSSFRCIVDDLYRLGLITLRELSWHDTEGYEFFVQLSRHGAGPSVDRATLALSALSATATGLAAAEERRSSPAPGIQSGPELVALAQANPRGEIIVRGASGHPLVYLIRNGRRHAIASPAWTMRHNYEGKDVVVVADDVILQVAAGEALAG